MKNSILAVLSITSVICIFVCYHFFIVVQQRRYVDNKLISSMKNSVILEQKIGIIKEIEKLNNKKFNHYKDNLYWKNFTIVLENNNRIIVKVIAETGTLIIYAYEIDGELILEENTKE